MKWFRIVGLLLALAVCQKVQAQTATVTWTNVHQTIDGFGASDWRTAESVSDAQADLFFSPTAGVGLDIVSVEGNHECGDTITDLVTMQKAVARGARIVLQMASPPISMKDSGSCGSGNLLTGSYAAYASYIVTYIQRMQTAGIPVYAVSPITEQDIICTGSVNNIGGFCLSPSQLTTFIKNNLGPALAAAGLSTKIRIGDQGQWFPYLQTNTTDCMNDSACKAYVSIVGAHGYGYYPNTAVGYYNSFACCSIPTAAPVSSSTGQLWMTEVSHSGSGNTFDGSIADGLVWAQNIHDYMTVANATGWLYWMLNGNSWFNDNEGLTDVSGNPAKRLYVLGNYSKFVRPGWVRIDTTTNPQSGVYVSAFKDPVAGNSAIVVINQNGSAVTQNVVLNGFNTTSVTPWVTSAALSLVQQSNISVSNNAFSYSLPANSVTTFVGAMDSGSAGSPPNPPTGLKAAVQ